MVMMLNFDFSLFSKRKFDFFLLLFVLFNLISVLVSHDFSKEKICKTHSEQTYFDINSIADLRLVQ